MEQIKYGWEELYDILHKSSNLENSERDKNEKITDNNVGSCMWHVT